jgi:hypothetical protein
MIRFAEEGEKPQPKPKLSKLDVARAVLEAVDKKRPAPAAVANASNKRKSGVNASGVNEDVRKGDRHAPGYMAGYMRKRRAEKCAHERERRTAAPGDKA